METFNIEVPYAGEEVTLTVMRSDDKFRLVFNGGIIGALQQQETDWEWLEEEDILVGELPFLKDKMGLNDESLPFGLPDINHIAAAIENHLNGHAEA